MYASPSDLEYSLLRHLGIHLFHATHIRPDGSQVQEVEIWTPQRHMNHVLGWRSRQHEHLQVIIHEGSPPPF